METAWGRIPLNGPGGDVDIKSGSSTASKGAEVQVNFAAAFRSAPTVVLTPTSDKGVWVTEVGVSYFKWDNDSKNTDVAVHWIAFGLSP